jgi:hypothetical protein
LLSYFPKSAAALMGVIESRWHKPLRGDRPATPRRITAHGSERAGEFGCEKCDCSSPGKPSALRDGMPLSLASPETRQDRLLDRAWFAQRARECLAVTLRQAENSIVQDRGHGSIVS